MAVKFWRTVFIIQMDGLAIGQGKGDTKISAKMSAAADAIEKLQANSFILVVKKKTLSDWVEISKDQFATQTYEDMPISVTNIGNKLLGMMGWNGGKVGVKGELGINEIIRPSKVVGRESLCLAPTSGGCNKQFVDKVTTLLKDYACSDSLNDLLFSSDFSYEERAIIQRIANRFHLKQKSHGKGLHLAISRRYIRSELLQFLRENGGSTETLIPPSGDVSV